MLKNWKTQFASSNAFKYLSGSRSFMFTVEISCLNIVIPTMSQKIGRKITSVLKKFDVKVVRGGRD